MTRRELLLSLGVGAVVAQGAEVPRPSPEFSVRLLTGQQLLLSSLKGKVLAVEFLMTTCPHCQVCSSTLQKVYRDYGPKGFQPIGVAFNDMATLLVPDYVKQLRLDFPVGVAPREDVQTYLQHPPQEILYVPQLIFIDRKFQIRGQYGGKTSEEFFANEEANMRKIIEALLKEPGGPAAAPKKGSGAKGKS